MAVTLDRPSSVSRCYMARIAVLRAHRSAKGREIHTIKAEGFVFIIGNTMGGAETGAEWPG